MMRMMSTIKMTMIAAAALLASACSMVPRLEQPALAVPDQWGAAAQSGAQNPASSEQLAWAAYFGDQRLQSLIRAALDNNRDLRVAVLNIEQTRAQYQIQRADRFPTVNAAINATRQPSATPPNDIGTLATGGLSLASFEIDLFGRIAALTQAAGAQLLATQEARKAVQISLVSAVASSYYTVWADQWQLALAEQTLNTRDASIKLLKLKYDNGVLNELDWRSAQSLVEAARIARSQAQRQRQLDINALSLLIGQSIDLAWLPPVPVTTATRSIDDLDAIPQITQASSLWPSLSVLPVGLPSEVLLKRPDIVQAEQLLIAANANIGAARAARFPRISLTASAGVASDSLSGLFNDGRSAWSFGGGLLAPIFDAGRTAANVTVTEVRRDVALAQYDKAIQTAFREVSDALVSRSTYGDQVVAQQSQVDAEAARLMLSGLRYRTGVSSQLDLLDSQRSLFAAQQALINTELARQQAHIAVFKTLGGGLNP